jgi:hypothetical protein
MREKIDQVANDFSKDFKLGGAVDVRVWGLAAHRSFLAIAITTQPKEHLFYLTSANSKLHVVFSHESLEPSLVQQPSQSSTPIKFPWRIHLDMDKPTSSTSEQKFEPPQSLRTISLISSARMNKQAIFARLCRLLLQPENFPEGTLDDLDLRVGEFINVEEAPEEIWKGWPGLKEMITGMLFSHWYAELKLLDSGGAVMCINEFIKKRAVEEKTDSTTHHMVEYCPLPGCHKPVFWTGNITDAYCESKHLLGKQSPPHILTSKANFWTSTVRCNRTAMALINPYCIKRCERCTRAYLDEERCHLYYRDAEAAGAITPEQLHRAIMLEDDYLADTLERTVRCYRCLVGNFVNTV